MITDPEPVSVKQRWYEGITRYQWLVLIIASAGWVFDVYEGQIFNLTRADLLKEMVVVDLPEMTPPADSTPEEIQRLTEQRNEQLQVKRKQRTDYLGDVFLGIFLAGGMVGGILFGMLGDRWGRRPTMIVTILMYSAFSGLTYFAQNLWQVGVLRFLVSMGIGGEWAVAAALVSEVFPARARAFASSIFHGSSTLGTWMAGLVALWIGNEWRYGYLVGVAPALLILWVRASLNEPETWKAESASGAGKGRISELFGDPRWRGRAIAGVLLAAVGLATFWGVTVAGQDLVKQVAEKSGQNESQAKSSAKFAYSLVQATGGGIGLVMFGPLCQWIGRKRAFVLAHLAGLAIVPITCFIPTTYHQLLWFLPFYGALTFGMHAGYAVYFPELFPTRLRALGSSVCFNGGRLVAAVMLPLSGYVKGLPDMKLPTALSLLALTYLLGLIVICYLPETKNQPLPE